MDTVHGSMCSVTDEQRAEYATWTLAQKLRWITETARFTRGVQRREERIDAYRLKAGENVAYYDTYGWPEHF